MLKYLRFVWDCGVCGLSCGDRFNKIGKWQQKRDTFFETSYLALNFNHHLLHIPVAKRDFAPRKQLSLTGGSHVELLSPNPSRIRITPLCCDVKMCIFFPILLNNSKCRNQHVIQQMTAAKYS